LRRAKKKRAWSILKKENNKDNEKKKGKRLREE